MKALAFIVGMGIHYAAYPPEKAAYRKLVAAGCFFVYDTENRGTASMRTGTGEVFISQESWFWEKMQKDSEMYDRQ